MSNDLTNVTVKPISIQVGVTVAPLKYDGGSGDDGSYDGRNVPPREKRCDAATVWKYTAGMTFKSSSITHTHDALPPLQKEGCFAFYN